MKISACEAHNHAKRLASGSAPVANMSSMLEDLLKYVLKWSTHYAQKQCPHWAYASQGKDDFAQDVAIRIWICLPRFDPTKGKFSTWLYGVCRNTFREYTRQRNRQFR